MMKRFVNDTYTVNKTRSAAKITKDQLTDLLIDAGEKFVDEFDRNEDNDLDYICEELLFNGIFGNDISYDLECMDDILTNENSSSFIPDCLSGLNTLSNGLTFYGFLIATDTGCAVYAIVYYDGSALRLYIPTRGNLINKDMNCILGTEDDDSLIEAYLNKFGIDYDYNLMPYDNLEFEWSAIQNEIETIIVVK